MRYLEKAFLNLDYAQYKLVHEALHERSFFFRAAPHLARPLPIILPVYDTFPSVLFYAPYYFVGCKAYDLVAGRDALEPSHWLSRRETLERFPMLARAGLKGATVYYDGQMNDSRMCLAVAQTAIAHGAACCNHVEVVHLLHRADGRVRGARVRDQLSGAEWEVRGVILSRMRLLHRQVGCVLSIFSFLFSCVPRRFLAPGARQERGECVRTIRRRRATIGRRSVASI